MYSFYNYFNKRQRIFVKGYEYIVDLSFQNYFMYSQYSQFLIGVNLYIDNTVSKIAEISIDHYNENIRGAVITLLNGSISEMKIIQNDLINLFRDEIAWTIEHNFPVRNQTGS